MQRTFQQGIGSLPASNLASRPQSPPRSRVTLPQSSDLTACRGPTAPPLAVGIAQSRVEVVLAPDIAHEKHRSRSAERRLCRGSISFARKDGQQPERIILVRRQGSFHPTFAWMPASDAPILISFSLSVVSNPSLIGSGVESRCAKNWRGCSESEAQSERVGGEGAARQPHPSDGALLPSLIHCSQIGMKHQACAPRESKGPRKPALSEAKGMLPRAFATPRDRPPRPLRGTSGRGRWSLPS